MTRSLVYTSLLVPGYDAALAFFTQALRWQGMQLLRLSAAKRWGLIQLESCRQAR